MKIADISVELMDFMGSDLSIVNAARVSFAKESMWETSKDDQEFPFHLSEKDQKLLAYLATHNHWSPFAHTSLQFRIQAPIFVARQLVKHQVGGVWNEVSRRYVDDEPVFYFPKQWRGRPINSKQGSEGVVANCDELEYHDSAFARTWTTPKQVCEDCLNLYQLMLLDGVAPEQARMVLPQNTMTEWIWTGSLYFFARVCKLRLDSHAQQETREVAEKINEQIPEWFEHSWKALMGDTLASTTI